MKCSAGLAEIEGRKYKNAARCFLQASFDHCTCSDVRKRKRNREREGERERERERGRSEEREGEGEGESRGERERDKVGDGLYTILEAIL